MRVNVYAEELTEHVQVTDSVVKTEGKDDKRFIGIRFILDSPLSLHYRDNDDDRSAVTFWVPGSSTRGYRIDSLINLFKQAIELLEKEKK